MGSSKVSFFRTKKDLYLNFDENKDKFILITGISGSGKSTLANKLSLETNGYKISFDLVFFHGAHSNKNDIEQRVVSVFKEKYPEWIPSVFEGLPSFEHDTFFFWSNKFYDFLLDYFKTTDRNIIIEGGHFFRYIDIEKIKDKKIIVKRTSVICCCFRRIKRTSKYFIKLFKNKEITLLRCVKAILRDILHIVTSLGEWYKKINIFINNFFEGRK